MKLVRPDSEWRSHDTKPEWHNAHEEDDMEDAGSEDNTGREGFSYFWKAFVLALCMACALILAGVILVVYASADPYKDFAPQRGLDGHVQFRTDQYIPPVISNSPVPIIAVPSVPSMPCK